MGHDWHVEGFGAAPEAPHPPLLSERVGYRPESSPAASVSEPDSNRRTETLRTAATATPWGTTTGCAFRLALSWAADLKVLAALSGSGRCAILTGGFSHFA